MFSFLCRYWEPAIWITEKLPAHARSGSEDRRWGLEMVFLPRQGVCSLTSFSLLRFYHGDDQAGEEAWSCSSHSVSPLEGTVVCVVFVYLMVHLFQTSSQRSISWPRSISAMHGLCLQRKNWGFSSKSRRPMESARNLGTTRFSWLCRPTRWYEGKCLVLIMWIKAAHLRRPWSLIFRPCPLLLLISLVQAPCPFVPSLSSLCLPGLCPGVTPGRCCLCRSISTSGGWTQTSLALKQTWRRSR